MYTRYTVAKAPAAYSLQKVHSLPWSFIDRTELTLRPRDSNMTGNETREKKRNHGIFMNSCIALFYYVVRIQ